MKLDEPARKKKYYDLLAISQNSGTTDPVKTDPTKDDAGDSVKDDTIKTFAERILAKWQKVLLELSLPLNTKMIPLYELKTVFNKERPDQEI